MDTNSSKTAACKVASCDKPSKALGLCLTHYQRQRRRKAGNVDTDLPRVLELDAPVRTYGEDTFSRMTNVQVTQDTHDCMVKVAKANDISLYALQKQILVEYYEKGEPLTGMLVKRLTKTKQSKIMKRGRLFKGDEKGVSLHSVPLPKDTGRWYARLAKEADVSFYRALQMAYESWYAAFT